MVAGISFDVSGYLGMMGAGFKYPYPGKIQSLSRYGMFFWAETVCRNAGAEKSFILCGIPSE